MTWDKTHIVAFNIELLGNVTAFNKQLMGLGHVHSGSMEGVNTVSVFLKELIIIYHLTEVSGD